jgi:hypothetical protein
MENNGVKLAEKMADYVNTFNRNVGKNFIEGFCRQHRTLQQSSFRMILELIEFMASDDYMTDGRNEGSKEVAKKLIKGFETEYQKELMSSGMSETVAKQCIGENFLPSKFLKFV